MPVATANAPAIAALDICMTRGRIPDLREIHSVMRHEKNMLHPPIGEIVRSFADGLACVLVDGEGSKERAVGYYRFIPLMDGGLKERLGLPIDFPDIWEMGSAVILPEYRGHHLARLLSDTLLGSQAARIRNHELLILGTTKTIKVVRIHEHALRGGSDELSFHICRHTDFSNIAALTCVCEGPMGTGMHLDYECSRRADTGAVESIRRSELSELPAARGPDIACVMYVSSRELAESINRRLGAQFDGLFASKLKEIGYYGSTLIQISPSEE